MYVKLINPATHGKAAYNNSGSSAQTLNYLKQEAAKDGQTATFFGADRDGIEAAELMQEIDTNVKGLRADDAKFYSLVISPSADELEHIGNDEQKLKAYTRAVMEQYAGNFNLKEGRQLRSEDLVWGPPSTKTEATVALTPRWPPAKLRRARRSLVCKRIFTSS
ncbi:DUF5712 family protein [Hymenobacter sp. J193]|uniref:DUF5712 family protein n=1 Tax=Hymenobacter sp. J193 TaxID=2898429 RepID=UPI0035B46CB7